MERKKKDFQGVHDYEKYGTTEPFDDVIFKVSSIASVNDCTGMGRGFPLFAEETEGLTEICEPRLPHEEMEADIE